MPIYEYECTECGNIEEALQKFSDNPLTRCKHCSGKLHKLVSNTSFHLKGTGWYVTDYAGKSHPSSANDNSSSKSDSSKVAGKTDTGTKTATTSTEK